MPMRTAADGGFYGDNNTNVNHLRVHIRGQCNRICFDACG